MYLSTPTRKTSTEGGADPSGKLMSETTIVQHYYYIIKRLTLR